LVASSSLKWPLVLRTLPLNHERQPKAMPRTQPELRYGWSRKVVLMSKMIFSKKPMVSFGLSLGGFAVTLLTVSRMEVRDGTMGLPVLVWSQ
jgi:hypothetical protein